MAVHISIQHPRCDGGSRKVFFASRPARALIHTAAEDLQLGFLGLIEVSGLEVSIGNSDIVIDGLRRLRDWLPTGDPSEIQQRFPSMFPPLGEGDREELIDNIEVAIQLIEQYVDEDLELMLMK